MPKFKVYALRTETIFTIVEADSAKEAEKAADRYYNNFDWSDWNEPMGTKILFGETKEEEDE